jgi:hypothetical protein
MLTNPPPEGDSQAQRLHNMEMSIEELNARIARLAIGLGISLENEAAVVQAMSQSQPTVAQERRSAAGQGVPAHIGTDRRMSHKRQELRGLLVLRYGVETRYVDEVGVAATRQIMTGAEAQMVRDGFKPGADGIDLDRLFKES